VITIGIDPVAFTIGPVVVRWYGILIAIAVLVLILWMVRETRRAVGLSAEVVLTGAIIAVPSGVIVAKLLHVIDNIVIAKLHPELALAGYVIDYTRYPRLIFTSEGLTIYGAVLGAALGIWIYSRVSRFPYGHVTDLLAPGIILAQAIGRVGCTINGCCYGLPISLPWGIVYTNPESYGYAASSWLPSGMGLHPTQVYEIIYNLIVFSVLFKLRGRLKPDGSLFALYLALYSAWRLGIGFLREGIPFLFGMQEAQFLAIIILIITVSFMVRKTRLVKKEEEAQSTE